MHAVASSQRSSLNPRVSRSMPSCTMGNFQLSDSLLIHTAETMLEAEMIRRGKYVESKGSISLSLEKLYKLMFMYTYIPLTGP